MQIIIIADNLSSTFWSNIALGRNNQNIETIIDTVDNGPLPIIDFSILLRQWRRNYIFVLKIAELELMGGNSKKRMMEILEWAYNNFQRPVVKSS